MCASSELRRSRGRLRRHEILPRTATAEVCPSRLAVARRLKSRLPKGERKPVETSLQDRVWYINIFCLVCNLKFLLLLVDWKVIAIQLAIHKHLADAKRCRYIPTDAEKWYMFPPSKGMRYTNRFRRLPPYQPVICISSWIFFRGVLSIPASRGRRGERNQPGDPVSRQVQLWAIWVFSADLHWSPVTGGPLSSMSIPRTSRTADADADVADASRAPWR